MTQSNLVGYAVYAEFQRGTTNTVQLLITPEGLTEEYQHVPPMLYRRSISTTSRRSTWRAGGLRRCASFNTVTGTLDAAEPFAGVSPASLPAEVGMPELGGMRLLAQLGNQSYILNKQLVVVEVSSADMADLRLARTPYKILNRITKSRKALGFSDSLFAGE